MSDPSVVTTPRLKRTESIVPARPPPNLASIPRHPYALQGNEVLLVIPTENEQKKYLLREFLQDQAPSNLNVHIITVPVNSGVGEQPYNEAGQEGAYNRINNALNKLDDGDFTQLFIQNRIGTIIVASIESYIQINDLDRPADFGIAVIHNATTGRTVTCSSKGVTVPPEYVSRAQRFGHDGDPNHGNITVGQILAARVPGLDKANWQVDLAGYSRYELIKEALEQVSVPW
jgi:non-canonical (house-cleaning) NTP pyrophosphatase